MALKRSTFLGPNVANFNVQGHVDCPNFKGEKNCQQLRLLNSQLLLYTSPLYSTRPHQWPIKACLKMGAVYIVPYPVTQL